MSGIQSPLENVILVDHGSPLPAVTEVRACLARQMRDSLGPRVMLHEAVMERRAGSEYDFNGPLLESLLLQMASRNPAQTVVLSMLFLSPGRHAGTGGDIEEICQRVASQYPGFRVITTPLVGEHPGLIDILVSRFESCLA